MRGTLRIAALAMFAMLMAVAHADSRRVIEYEYDEAGNIVRIGSEVGEDPPVVTSLTPSVIRVGPAVSVVAEGSDLLNAQVAGDDPGLTVSNVGSTSTAVTFDLQASDNTPLGDHLLTFTTPLGSATATIAVQPRLPVVAVSPAPVAVSPGASVVLDVRLSTADLSEHTLELAIADPTVAAVTPSFVTIVAGETRAAETIQLSGATLGTTTLRITSATLAGFSTTVFVTDAFALPQGDNTVISPPLGVVLTPPPSQPELIERTPFVDQLNVLKGLPPSPTDDLPNLFVSPSLGVALGDVVLDITPDHVAVDTGPDDLTISGIGLDEVTAVAIIPEDDIEFGAPTIGAQGQSVTVPITVFQGAEVGPRQVIVAEGEQLVPPVSPQADRIRITPAIPEIISLDPITVTRTETTILNVQGRNFEHVESVNIIPAADIEIGSIVDVNEQGTNLSVEISIGEFAELGPRVVTVTASAGTSDDTPSEANTLTIVNGPVVMFDDLASSLVGVLKGEPEPTAPEIGLLSAPNVGVMKGSIVTGLAPSAQPVGSQFTLTISGVGLQGVTDVAFLPTDGITVGAITPAADGLSVSVDVSIDDLAPETLRQVLVEDVGERIPSMPASADRFRVTALQPLVRSVNPNVILAGTSRILTVDGQFLNDAVAVRLLPGDGLFVDPPVVNAAGDLLTVEVVVDENAALGPRALVVETLAGESPAMATPANTVTIAGEIVLEVSPLIASALGVVKGSGDGGPTPDLGRLLVAPLLGVVRSGDPGSETRQVPLVSAQLGVATGPIVTGLVPPAAGFGTEFDLFIEGVGLDQATEVFITPDDGITQTGFIDASPDGLQVTVPLAIDLDAPETLRQVTVNTATGAIPFKDPSANRLRITGNLPEISSIEPIQEVVGAQFELVIRGINLQQAAGVEAIPADGILFNTPVASLDGREVIVETTIQATAQPGPRAIVITTPAGTSANEPTAANTFTVIAQ